LSYSVTPSTGLGVVGTIVEGAADGDDDEELVGAVVGDNDGL
jgi:hypothetical protein